MKACSVFALKFNSNFYCDLGRGPNEIQPAFGVLMKESVRRGEHNYKEHLQVGRFSKSNNKGGYARIRDNILDAFGSIVYFRDTLFLADKNILRKVDLESYDMTKFATTERGFQTDPSGKVSPFQQG
eukprot:CAMPEP_0170493080 /NCGR_PEP_ID=MMETSP0208-20121228/13327_1 /TAXON_ID=197538 /ORGANISM="Strombidium inclinatum, Strain S3" /LENGTH=126 /DNA_ID=CAMNT_0010768949 /DNA_START=361 /DNA_END=741 /DNA_ORIENTATION=-